MEIAITKEDADILTELMRAISDNRINMADFSKEKGYDADIIVRLGAVLILNGHASISRQKGTDLGQTNDTFAALNSDYYGNMYRNQLAEKERKEKGDEKIGLEIKSLKKNIRYAKPALLIGILSGITAIISLLWQIAIYFCWF
jgi:hypothetical protein